MATSKFSSIWSLEVSLTSLLPDPYPRLWPRRNRTPGGNVNITDEDGDTPLYTVEDVETAQWLVSHGATVDMRNTEGRSVSYPFTPSHHQTFYIG